jgi:excinuclease ABC subunit A
LARPEDPRGEEPREHDSAAKENDADAAPLAEAPFTEPINHPMPIERITIRGARTHNLKNVSAQIPRNRLTVITGMSGSGKSSLAFDTIYAEGQRRFIETLSAYARQFLDQMDRPDVDTIEGLSPAISIEQKTTGRSPRSTVGTVTEIHDYLRLLWYSIGTPHCPNCGRAISRQTGEQIAEALLDEASADAPPRLIVMAPIVRGRKGEFRKELEKLARDGFLRARVDGVLRPLDEEIRLDKRRNHTIEVVVDRLLLRPGVETRLLNSIKTAMKLADGLVLVSIGHGPAEPAGRGGTGSAGKGASAADEERLFSEKLACPDCGINVPQLEPRSFSFNSTYGACESCSGLGSRFEFDPDKVIVDWSKPLLDGGLGPGSSASELRAVVTAFARARGISLQRPFSELPARQRNELLYGTRAGANGKQAAKSSASARPGRRGDGSEPGFQGIIPWLQELLDDATTDAYRDWLFRYTSPIPCSACGGRRLRPESLAVKVRGLSIADFVELPLAEAQRALAGWTLSEREGQIAGKIVAEIRERLQFLLDVGVGYLTLGRAASTLSGGEAQRIRLARQIGSKLRGVLYVLDEPSIGLHHRDNDRLLRTLERLRDLGNTVLVVEHDATTIERADYVLDLGPGAGRQGGELVAAGTPAEIEANAASLTGRYLSGALEIAIPRVRRAPTAGAALRLTGASAHNLRHVDVSFPAGLFIVVTGVSGSGKSSLVNDTLYPALAHALYRSSQKAGDHDRLHGAELFDKVIRVDQAPIGRTPRSNPATYTAVFSPIRDLFSMLPEARERGYKPGRFSFNVKGGRCEACQGEGQKRIEMNFLPDVYVQCDVCRGRRYNQETLAVRYNGLSIADVLDSTIEDALALFQSIPQIRQKLQTLVDVGLGYLHLGQSATTLSGGEAQRIKLARELSRRQTGRTLYMLDEPTTGLHFHDIGHLLAVLQKLVDFGNTVIVIEHNLDIIKSADWIIDLGPEGGAEGGLVVAEGAPEEIATVAASHTGRALRTVLSAGTSSSVAETRVQ